MNNSVMIRQYAMLAVVILIAIFIATQIDWDFVPDRRADPIAERSTSTPEGSKKSAPQDVSLRDLRGAGTGGVLRRRARSEAFKTNTNGKNAMAPSSSPFSAATSTQFQAGEGAATPLGE